MILEYNNSGHFKFAIEKGFVCDFGYATTRCVLLQVKNSAVYYIFLGQNLYGLHYIASSEYLQVE